MPLPAALPPAPPPAIAIAIDRLPLETDVAPIAERGTVLVPARAVFDALGARLRYDAATGKIFVVRGSHEARTTVGQTVASVDGRSLTLPIAPRVVDARLFVPLPFVSDALGGVARYDAATATVSITGAGEIPSARDPLAVGTAEAALGVTVSSQMPTPGSAVANALPAISGEFQTRGGPEIDPDSVRIGIDGVDETPLVRREGEHFGFTPGEPLEPGEHEVDVDGLDRAGTPFDLHWTFTVTADAAYEAPVMTLAPGSEGSGVGVTYEDAPYDYGSELVISEPLGQYGNAVQFAYAAPPGGSGFVSLCGLSGVYPFRYDPGTRRYLADVAVPPGVYAPSCYVTGSFVGAGGSTHLLPPISPIAIDTTKHDPQPRAVPVVPAPVRTSLPDADLGSPGLPGTRTVAPVLRTPGQAPAGAVTTIAPAAQAAATAAPLPETRSVRSPGFAPTATSETLYQPRRVPLATSPSRVSVPPPRPAPVPRAVPPPRRPPATSAR